MNDEHELTPDQTQRIAAQHLERKRKMRAGFRKFQETKFQRSERYSDSLWDYVLYPYRQENGMFKGVIIKSNGTRLQKESKYLRTVRSWLKRIYERRRPILDERTKKKFRGKELRAVLKNIKEPRWKSELLKKKLDAADSKLLEIARDERRLAKRKTHYRRVRAGLANALKQALAEENAKIAGELPGVQVTA